MAEDQAEQEPKKEAAENDDVSPVNETSVTDAISPADQVENKRLSDSNPRELELAFRQVLVQPAREGVSNSDPFVNAEVEENKTEEPDKKAKGTYNNRFNLWADIFYGVLVAPRQTMLILSDSSRFPASFGNIVGAALLVVLVLGLTSLLRYKGDNASAVTCSAFLLSGLGYWLTLSLVLYYLSIWLRDHRLTLGNAFIATGWAFLPFAFYAPIACLKSTPVFLPLAVLPAIWFLALEWVAFQTSLRTSAVKLGLILLVVPPVITLVYLFWIGLACFSLFSQVLNALLPQAAIFFL